MSSLVHARRPLLRVLAVAATAAVLLTTALATGASAHGNVTGPPSRNYGCLDRWGTNHQSPAMVTEDPMCNQAWRADPNAMWNWNSLFREGVAGNHQAAIPNGQLCSAGLTVNGRYRALDVPGNWRSTAVNNNFSVRLYDQARHGADYVRVYVTRQGFNPLTQTLSWSDLQLVNEIGDTPAAQWDEVTGGVAIDIPAAAPGRTGRHIVYTIWQASHADQSYYFCSDVTFPGGANGGGNPTPSPTPSASPSASPSPRPTASPPVSPPVSPSASPSAGGSAGCTASYTVTGQWTGGFQAEVRVTAGTTPITGWRVTWTYANGQRVSSSWNSTLASDGSTVTASNAGYNGRLAANGSVTFGLLGAWSGSNTAPTLSCSAA
ncbi:MAG TPA: lytic polysaccharide monooxygenase [Pilimelia sp.]|nr:lytic polysaccharide monooxygenase [Pilimelia sp.]